MKELVYAGWPVLIGDAAADAVVDYTVVLARARGADAVELRALTEDGHPVEVYYVLGATSAVMAQTVDSSEPEPDNDTQVEYMRAATRRLSPDLLVDTDLVAFERLD